MMHDRNNIVNLVDTTIEEGGVYQEHRAAIVDGDNHTAIDVVDDDDDVDITCNSLQQPIKLSFGGRSISTAKRLQQQGFRASSSRNIVQTDAIRTSLFSTSSNSSSEFFTTPTHTTNTDFAMKSIRRGSMEWNIILRPFVANITFESFVHRRYHRYSRNDIDTYNIVQRQRFRPYTCYAAVLFVDLCNYSRITTTIAHRGAHVLSSIVNDYLHRILLIVKQYGGDVIKFAGDAIIVIWYSTDESQLSMNVIIAAQCVLDMQQKAGNHPVDGTTLHFNIHCGLSCGLIESEVFSAPNHTHMQRLFHSIGGTPVVELSELVDMAKPGEVCVSNDVVEHLNRFGKYVERLDESGVRFFVLTELVYNKDVAKSMKIQISKSRNQQQEKRTFCKAFEEEFIHPNVIKLLSHGGLSPTQISQMRNLCVLFIAMTSSYGSTVNWLMEVQTILDRNRCPIIQILDDDKGVHLVAAVNLAESIPECSLVGLEICRELIAKEVGCVIGMASGSTFCGVTGSSDIACRWDIAGAPAVRAARLMQYAESSDACKIAIDQSVYDDPMAFTRLKLFDSAVQIKGTKVPIPIYTLSNCQSSVAFRVLETVHARVHDDLVNEVTQHITSHNIRVAVIVTGCPLAGKKIICQRAAGRADMVPYLHLSDESAGFLQLAKTIATWFQYVDNAAVRSAANKVLTLLLKQHWSRSHDECIDLVELAIVKGFRTCFLIDRVQFLDEFSLSLLRECLSERINIRSSRRRGSMRRTSNQSEASQPFRSGKICFLCVHVSFYNGKSALDVIHDISRSNETLEIPIIRVGEAKREELRVMFRDISDMEVEDRWLDAYAESSGYCAGYFIERAAAIRTISSKLWSKGERPYAETTERLVLHIPYGLVRRNKTLPVMEVSAEVAMRFHQIFDELPPFCQTALKVMTVSSRCGFYYQLPLKVLWEVLNDLIADGIDWDIFSTLLEEMADLYIIKIINENDKAIAATYRCPAFADVAFDVSTPVQIKIIAMALIERLEPLMDDTFVVPLVLASLHNIIGDETSDLKSFWCKSYNMLLNESISWTESETNKWKECIVDEITFAGFEPIEILGEQFSLHGSETRTVGKILPLLKIYSAPVSFGPMGHSLSVITRNTFHEFGVFHGAHSADATKKLYESSISASQRYLHQMNIIEGFLTDNGVTCPFAELNEERNMIIAMVQPAVDGNGVQEKAERILNEFIPRFVKQRKWRLHTLVNKLRAHDIPEVIVNADIAINRAYTALRADKDITDAVQDALVIMATMNWKPKVVPEYLPLLHYQTVARLRNKVLKRLNDAELFMFKHQQSHIDLEAFLIVTALLSNDG